VDESSKYTDCITAKKFEEDQHKYIMTLPGTYDVEVRAVPLYAEPGQWTKPIRVNFVSTKSIAVTSRLSSSSSMDRHRRWKG
jgi:hypothetical protein